MKNAQSLLETLIDCLNQLDSIGASTAAAHLDAAIQSLASNLQNREASKTA